MLWLIFFIIMAVLFIIVAVLERRSATIVSAHKLVNSEEWLTEDVKAALSYGDNTFEEVF